MIRCDKCDIRIEKEANYTTTLALVTSCPDGQYRSKHPYEQESSQRTGNTDLCVSCQTEAFRRLQEVGEEFGCKNSVMMKGVPPKAQEEAKT
jgi:hypothetical protein